VCAGQREAGIIMVESACTLPCGMAGITGIALITVPTDAFVSRIGFGLVVLVTVNAAENCIIIRISMAIDASCPFALVLP
jgi:hypothetical protein